MNPFKFVLPDVNDQSVTILDQITGVVKYFITGDPNDIVKLTFTRMLMHFNEALLACGLIIFAVLLFVGTINTAADGQFLGRNWNSVWTPIRIIFGVLFVVPLKTGLCFGQYIFLYVILIGIQIATFVWNQVVDDVFNHYTPPAVPSYVNNYALETVENQVILTTMQNISKIWGDGNGISSPIQINNVYHTSSGIPASVQDLLMPEIEAVCSTLYSSQPIQTDCAQNIEHVLTGSQTNGALVSDPAVGASGNIGVWIGSDLSLPSSFYFDDTISKNNKNHNSSLVPSLNLYLPGFWTNPDGQITVSGSYTYQFPTASENMDQAGQDFQKDLQTEVNNLVNQKIMTTSSPGTNLCTSGSGCSLSAVANIIVAAAQQRIEGATPTSSGLSPTCTVNQVLKRDQSGNIVIGPDGKPVMVPETDSYGNLVYTCPLPLQNTDANGNKSLLYYQTEGMPYIDAKGNVQNTEIDVPLKGSWWNAGASYLILDNQFSQNLGSLIDAIQQNLTNLLSNQTLTGTTNISTNIMVEEESNDYQTADSATNSWENQALVRHCIDIPLSSNIPGQTQSLPAKICGVGSMMVYPAQPLNVSSSDTSFAGIGNEAGGSSDTWDNYIQWYDPNLLPTDPNADNPTQYAQDYQKYAVINTNHIDIDSLTEFYNNLENIPAVFQVPIEILLQQTQNEIDNRDANCPTDSGQQQCWITANTNDGYVMIYPYLQNLVNVLNANGLLNNSVQDLPVNQAMNSMFTQMLGPAAASDPRIRSINSVMQDIYNLGENDAGDIISQQFSLIQQVRNTGIGVIVTCLESIQVVYDSYTAEMNNMVDKVKQETHGGDATASKALMISSAALSGISGVSSFFSPGVGTLVGALGSAASTTSQILLTQVQLAVTTTTLTTLSNIAIQMMWLPLFAFVMVSLFTAGVQFALLIPFMPYIMFWAGQMAWVIGVLEALIAAPLVMLAFAHPGGNEYVGHAAPAVRFLIGIIFRPVLMVIGLITGILLTYVLIYYSAQGFHIIAASIFSSLPAQNTTLMGVMSCLLVFTYATFLVMAFTKCFSPIYVIPEKVVQWINGHADRAGEQEAQQFGSSVQQSAQSGGQAGGQTLQQGASAQQTHGQNMSNLTEQQFSKGLAMTASSKASEAGSSAASSLVQFNAKD